MMMLFIEGQKSRVILLPYWIIGMHVLHLLHRSGAYACICNVSKNIHCEWKHANHLIIWIQKKTWKKPKNVLPHLYRSLRDVNESCIRRCEEHVYLLYLCHYISVYYGMPHWIMSLSACAAPDMFDVMINDWLAAGTRIILISELDAIPGIHGSRPECCGVANTSERSETTFVINSRSPIPHSPLEKYQESVLSPACLKKIFIEVRKLFILSAACQIWKGPCVKQCLFV